MVLNVLGYDETCHQMGQIFGSKKYGNYKSFTLGEQQQKFVEKTLTESRRPFKVVFIHHALGGRAKDAVNADYGRGCPSSLRFCLFFFFFLFLFFVIFPFLFFLRS